jgi:hypothetical protein
VCGSDGILRGRSWSDVVYRVPVGSVRPLILFRGLMKTE